jgi:ABC-2 type transport system permease protein
MNAQTRYGRYSRFGIYLLAVVLVNIAGLTLFFRIDLTSNHAYSLSEASKKAVGSLSEPLTINVFFTKNLPAPHNITERYLHDLLEEYAAHSNRYFNYRFYDVSAEEGNVGEEAKRNQEMARGYGIYPVQLQKVEQDEVKFQNAYMGLVLIHGDVVDKIPAITSTDGLEYRITSKIEKMTSKISALENMKDKISLKLFFSSNLADVAPHMRMEDLTGVPDRIEKVVGELNKTYYDRLDLKRYDTTADTTLFDLASRYNVLTLRWPTLTDRTGREVLRAGRGAAGLVVEHGGKHETIPLIKVVTMPLFGTQYQLVGTDEIKETLGEALDDVIDVNKKIGYLSSNGTLPLSGTPQAPGQMQQEEGISNFNSIVSQNYSIVPVDLKGDKEIPEGIDCLVIAGPTEQFNDWEIFQIDQFLMRGKSLAFLIDPYREMQAQQQYGRQPFFLPIDTGLDSLLAHYGAGVGRSYVLDKSCYEQRTPQSYGGGEQALYFAPVIKPEKIDSDLPFMRNIKGLVTLMCAPVELREETIKRNSLRGDVVFSSSDESWLMSGRIDLSPWSIQPPENRDEYKSYPLAVMLRGPFPSYFAGKGVPPRPEPTGADSLAAKAAAKGTEEVAHEGTVIQSGSGGTIFLIGTSAILKNNIIDEQGTSINAIFILNVLDDLNGRDEYAAMRSKLQQFNPLRSVSGASRTLIKTFNIAGLPVIVVVFGIFVWARRAARKKAIQEIFGG